MMTKSQLDAQIARHREQIAALCADLAACNDRAARIEKAVRAIVANEHVNLGDLVYQVREREGLGWEGPSVKAWSDAVDALEAALKEAP